MHSNTIVRCKNRVAPEGEPKPEPHRHDMDNLLMGRSGALRAPITVTRNTTHAKESKNQSRTGIIGTIYCWAALGL